MWPFSWLPALLSLNDAGIIGVKIVDDQETARFVPVQILGDEIDGIWIAGLGERARLITVGHEFVKSGQKVRAVDEAAGKKAGAPAS